MSSRENKILTFVHPMLAKEADEPFDNKDWIFEVKWDGYRAISEVNKNTASLYSRNGNPFNLRYPSVIEELRKLNRRLILDGEIVVLDDYGKPDFQKLQFYEQNKSENLYYYVFDLLSIDGKDICKFPLMERKKVLKSIIRNNSALRYSDHIESKGIEFFDEAKSQGLEGIIGKKTDSTYQKGARTGDWLKIKVHHTVDAIVAGFTRPRGARKHFGALILAVMEKGRLKYVGHTGTGFSEHSLKEISKKLKPLVRSESPFQEKVFPNMPVTWAKPVLVAEIKFTEWTREKKLRHPIFQRLRNDKLPEECTMNNLTSNKPDSYVKSSKAKASA